MSGEKIKFKYIFDDDYQPKFTNGVYGGLNPTGELIAHFYFERFPLPYETEMEIYEDGSANEEVIKPKEYKHLRRIHSGVIMEKDTALTMYKWLGEALREMGVSDDELRNFGDNND